MHIFKANIQRSLGNLSIFLLLVIIALSCTKTYKSSVIELREGPEQTQRVYRITTINNKTCEIKGYTISGDTLITSVPDKYIQHMIKIKIPLAEIQKIERVGINGVKTTILLAMLLPPCIVLYYIGQGLGDMN
jgi:hypothetical protein